MSKEAFLLNYDVEQEQRELEPLAHALQGLAEDFSRVLPLFWRHLHALNKNDRNNPMTQEFSQENQEKIREHQNLIEVLNQLPEHQKGKIRESITEKSFEHTEATWLIPIDAVIEKNGITIPIEAVRLKFRESQYECDALEITEYSLCNEIQCQYPYNVRFRHGQLKIMDYKAKNAAGKIVPFRTQGNENRPSILYWGESPLRIHEVRFLNGQELSRKNGAARIIYTVNAEGVRSIASALWYYNGNREQGIEQYKKRLAVWKERMELTDSMASQEQEQQVGIASHAKKKKL